MWIIFLPVFQVHQSDHEKKLSFLCVRTGENVSASMHESLWGQESVPCSCCVFLKQNRKVQEIAEAQAQKGIKTEQKLVHNSGGRFFF